MSVFFAKISGISRGGLTPLHYFHVTAMYLLVYRHLGLPKGPSFDNLMRLCWLLEEFCGDSVECFTLADFSPPEAPTHRFEELLEILTGSIRAWGDFLSRRKVNLDYTIGTLGRTSLMIHLLRKEPQSLSSVAVLLGCGANVAATDIDGLQPLYYALAINDGHRHSLDIGMYTHSQLHETQLNMIRLLITAGADVYAFDNYGWSPLDLAIDHSTAPIFFEALRHCDIPPEDYTREHDRRKVNWRRLHGAKRTAVDTEFIESPSRTGLIKRQKRAFEENI